MTKQNHLSRVTCDENPPVNAVLKMLLVVAVLALYLYPPTARAQFSGPALTISTPANLPVSLTTDPAILYPANRDIILERSDLLTIHLYGNPDYAPEVRISLDGTIQLPLIGSLHVEGLSLHQAENLIAERLTSAGMYRCLLYTS